MLITRLNLVKTIKTNQIKFKKINYKSSRIDFNYKGKHRYSHKAIHLKVIGKKLDPIQIIKEKIILQIKTT